MLPNPKYSQVCQESGLLTVDRRVVKNVIHRIALNTPGVVQLGGDSIWKRLFKRFNLRTGPRGIELELADGEAAMTLHVVARFGIPLPSLANDLRGKIKKALKEQLGIDVRTVNVHVKSLKFSHQTDGELTDYDASSQGGLLTHDALPKKLPPKRRFELE